MKALACEAVKKSGKLLKFVLNDGTGENRVILSGIHEYHEPEQPVGKTRIAFLYGMRCGLFASLDKPVILPRTRGPHAGLDKGRGSVL